MSRVILPSRPLTEEEARGFRMACACFQTIGQQISQPQVTVAGPLDLDLQDRFRFAGDLLVGYARAFDRTIGRNATA